MARPFSLETALISAHICPRLRPCLLVGVPTYLPQPQVFQVLLGQVDDNESHAFILLVLMTVVSPVVTWAANQLARDDVPGVLAQLKTRQKPTSSEDPKCVVLGARGPQGC